MDEVIEPHGGQTPEQPYDASYYACHCGAVPYERSPYWLGFFGTIADELVRSLRPRRVLDAGCALGLLVENLWDRGVEAYGRDISDYAIANVRPDIRDYCEVGSIADPFSGRYDLVTCIEVLEHIPEPLAIAAIRQITAVAPRILFSSSPDDFDEPTHVNVRPTIYWLRRFAEAGFAPVVDYDATFLVHHAMLLERADGPIDDRLLVGHAEIIRLRLATRDRDRQIIAGSDRDKQLQAQLQDAAALLEAERTTGEAQRNQLGAQAEQLRAQTEQIQSLAEQLRAQSEQQKADRDALERQLCEIAARDMALAGLQQEASYLREFRTGVYRNPFFIPVRVSSRLWNLLFRSRLPLSRRPGVKRLLQNYRHSPWARHLVGRMRHSGPGRFAWSLLRRSRLVRDLVTGFRSAGDLPQAIPAVAVPLPPPATPAGPDIGYVPPAGLLPWFTPLHVAARAELADRPHLNILLPGIGMKYMSGGPNTAVNIGYRLGLLGVAVRFVSTDVAADTDQAEFWRHVRALAETDEILPHVTLVDAHDRAQPLAVGENDIFMATAWWTAQMAKYAMRHTRHRRFVYLIQDYEPLFHGASTQLALSAETYRLDCIPVINTSLLGAFLRDSGIGRFADPDFAAASLVFEPAIDKTRFHPAALPAYARKRRLLFYARPTNALRNLFEIGVAALQKLIQEGKLDPARWEITAIGEQFAPIPLAEGLLLRPAPWLDFDGYARLMRESDLLLSMMLSPHPSYPPLEMAACGRPVVTTCYGNKTREQLAAISPNIIGCEPTVEEIADGLLAAMALAEQPPDPTGTVTLPHSWGESFAPVLPRLYDALLQLQGAPAASGGRFPGYGAWPHDHYATLRPLLLGERDARYRDAEPALLSFLTPVWNTDPAFVQALADSLFQQDSGAGFEWIIIDNGSDRPDTIALLRRLAEREGVRLERVEKNLGIIGALRRCLELARHRYIVPLDSDDLLTPDAVRILTSALKTGNYPALAYTDEDKIEGERPRDAYFKPDWDPVLFTHSCYIAHLCAIDRERALALGCYSDPAPQGSHDWDSFMRFHLAGYEPLHVPEVVYSWRMHADSTSGNFRSKDYIFDSQRHVIEKLIKAAPHPERYRVEPSPIFPGTPDWRICRTLDGFPPITTLRVGAAKAGMPSAPDLPGHRIEQLADARDLAALLARVEACAAEGRLVHLLAGAVEVSDPSWAMEAATLFELFPDTVMIGGRLLWQETVLDADRYFGFGRFCDSPNRGRPVRDPGFFVQIWKPHSCSAVPVQHCVARPDFLAAALRPLVGSGLSFAALGPWLGAAAARRGGRVVYSPFLMASAAPDMLAEPDAGEEAGFRQAYRDLIPERRLLSPHLGLTPATVYRPLPAQARAAEEARARVLAELPYQEAFAAELLARRTALADAPRPASIGLLTSVYARTPVALFRETARSVLAQSQPAAEWILLENGPIAAELAAELDSLERAGRIRRFRLAQNDGITGSLRFCLEQASADYVLPLDADDLLTPDALQLLAAEIERSGSPGLVYSDEDLLSQDRLSAPLRRAAFDPVLNAADSYIWHVCAFRRETALALGCYSDRGAEFCQDWDVVRRFESAGEQLRHLPAVLYHWRIHGASSSNSGQTNEGSLASVRHLLSGIVARQARPDLYEVAPFPLDRGAVQYAILRRRAAPLPLALVYVAGPGERSLPDEILRQAGEALAESLLLPADSSPADTVARLATLRSAHVLVLAGGCRPVDAAGYWEAMRLFEMHADVAAVGGRISDRDGVLRDSCAPQAARDGVPECWTGLPRSDGGAFAMRLKPQSASALPRRFFACHAGLLREAAALTGDPLDWAETVASLAVAAGQRLAYSPLIEAELLEQAASEPALHAPAARVA